MLQNLLRRCRELVRPEREHALQERQDPEKRSYEQALEHQRQERESRWHEQALYHERELALLVERERRERERQRQAKWKWVLTAFVFGVLVGGLMFHSSPGQRDVMPGVSPGSRAQQEGARTDTAEPSRKPTVQCSDGTMSRSSGSGTCSDHGGEAKALVERAPTKKKDDSLAQPATGDIHVRGYHRQNGTYVHPYTRTSPHR
jgi:hypothetical protein